MLSSCLSSNGMTTGAQPLLQQLDQFLPVHLHIRMIEIGNLVIRFCDDVNEDDKDVLVNQYGAWHVGPEIFRFDFLIHLLVPGPVKAGELMMHDMVLLLQGKVGAVHNCSGVDEVIGRLPFVDECMPHNVDDGKENVGLHIRIDAKPKYEGQGLVRNDVAEVEE